MSNNYETITEKLAIWHQTSWDDYGCFVNMSDVGRILVHDETGNGLCVVDNTQQAESELALYAWIYLNGRNTHVDSAPVIYSHEQLEYIKDRIYDGELVRLRDIRNDCYMQKVDGVFEYVHSGIIDNLRAKYNIECVQRGW